MAAVGRLAGKVAFITGAGGGIASETARLFASEGAAVIAVDANAAALDTLKAALCAAGATSSVLVCDVTQEAAVAQAVAQGVAALGPIDVLFNCAGGSAPNDGPITEVDMTLWQRTIDVDLLGTMLCCRHVIPHMVKLGRGSVINTSSWSALRGSFHKHLYMAAKGGIISFTRGLAGEYAGRGIRANTIVPGAIKTPRTIGRHAAPDPNDPLVIKRRRMEQDYPFSTGTAIDIANIVLFLASDESRMITGATIPADGGRSAY